MKILIVHNSLNDGKSMSGVLKHYLLMAKGWMAMGHQVDFCMAKAGWGQVRAADSRIGWVCSDPFFDATHYLDQTWRYMPAYAYRMLSPLWMRLSPDYDVVYASNFLIFEVLPAWWIARRCRARLVLKIQHMFHAQAERTSLVDRLFLASERWSMRIAQRFANCLMCLSRSVRRDYDTLARSMSIQAPRVPHIVGCGLDFSVKEQTIDPPKQYDVVLLARMHEQKGIFDLPRVWQSVLAAKPDARLLVIGEGPHRKQLMQAFEHHRLANSVTFTGGVEEEIKDKLIRQSRMALSLSFEEGWGLSVMECLAVGLPVVAYRLPVFEELFEEVLSLVPLRDTHAAAEAILTSLRAEASPGNEKARQARIAAVSPYGYREVARQELDLMLSA